MSPRRRLYSFWIDEAHLAGLKAVKERDGVLPSEQIRRALADWLDRKAVLPKPKATTRQPLQKRRSRKGQGK